MGLLDWQDLLHDHPFLFFFDLVKRGVAAGNVKPVDDSSAPQNKFFLIARSSRKGIHFKSFPGGLDDMACLLREAAYLIG